MPLFKSPREKRLWFWSLLVLIGIYGTLGLARTFAGYLRDREMLTGAFILGLILVLASIVTHGIRTKASRLEVSVWIGIIAVYLLVCLRLSIAEERGHLVEYGILAIFIHKALLERKEQGGNVKYPALLAMSLATLFGAIDECIQLFMTSRVFDPLDILFNTFAATMAIVSGLLLQWAKRKTVCEP